MNPPIDTHLTVQKWSCITISIKMGGYQIFNEDNQVLAAFMAQGVSAGDRINQLISRVISLDQTLRLALNLSFGFKQHQHLSAAKDIHGKTKPMLEKPYDFGLDLNMTCHCQLQTPISNELFVGCKHVIYNSHISAFFI